MKILKVGIKNLNSLRLETSIDFAAPPLNLTGLFAIVGDTGAGKTTILDAITLGLYGAVARQAKPAEVMTYGTADAYAEVDFETPSGQYRSRWSIWRSHGRVDGNIQGPKHEVSKYNPQSGQFEIIAEKTKETKAVIEEVSGLDFLRFTKSVLLSQGEFAAFLKSKNQERSDLLERITGTEIYSQLSIAAHERHREEQEKLQQLEQKKEGLASLDASVYKQIKQERKTLEKSVARQKIQRDEARAILDDHFRYLQLKEEEARLIEQQSALEDEKKSFRTEQNALQSHKKVLPFQNDFSNWQHFKREKEALADKIVQLKNQIDHFQSQAKNKKAELAAAEKSLNSAEKDLNDFEALAETVSKLDVQIESRLAPLQDYKDNQQQTQTAILELEKQLENAEDEAKQLRKRSDEIENWLNQNRQFENIGESLGVIRRDVEELKKVVAEIEQVEKSAESSQKEYNSLRDDLDSVQKELEAHRDQNEQLLEDLKEFFPDTFTTDYTDLLRISNQKIDKLNTSYQQLKALQEADLEYRKILTELNETESSLESIQTLENEIDGKIINCLEELDELGEQLNFRQQNYEQQLRVANYEKDRETLPPDTPCPLCFSKEHPFREMELTPYVDLAKKELEKIKSQHDKTNKIYRKLLEKQSACRHERERLAGDLSNVIKGKWREKYEQLLTFENRIVGLTNGNREAHPTNLTESVEKFKNALDEYKAQREKTETVISKLSQLDKTIQKKQKKEQELKAARSLADERKNSRKERMKTLRQKRTTIGANLKAALADFDVSFSPREADRQIKTLEEKKAAFQSKSKEKQLLKEQISLVEKDIQQFKKSLATQKQTLKTTSNKLRELQLEFDDLKSTRFDLFEDKSIAEEKTKIKAALEITAREKEATQKDLETVTASIKASKDNRAEKENDLLKLTKALSKVESKLDMAAQQTGFEDKYTMQSQLLETGRVTEIEKQEKRLHQKELEIKQSVKTNAEALSKLKNKVNPDAETQTLKSTLIKAETNYDELNQQLGMLKQKIHHYEEQQNEMKQVARAIENQRLERDRWAKLRDLIGSHDGQRFRIFAQSLTLENLVILGNRYLQKLDDRYRIQKESGDHLELQIIDTYQADNVRSMNTLSGGETFLVSLALALGLSDLAGRQTQIRSLFIDEGFGTLDEQTLDIAITTLENLQSLGKTIGVISHVKALKERITTQIQLIKKSAGVSELKIVS